MIVMVNEKQVEVDEQTTVAALLESLGFPDRGIAVAIDFSVLPRSDSPLGAGRTGEPVGGAPCRGARQVFRPTFPPRRERLPRQ